MIGLVGDRDGFTRVGGVNRLKELLVRELIERGIPSRTVLPGEDPLDGLRVLIVIGCSSPWAYGLVLASRLLSPTRPVAWIPCFHPPRFVRHRLRAWLAKRALRALQFLGVEVCALSWAERKELATVRCSVISLPFRIESPPTVPAAESPAPADPERPYALVFLGRPVAQKGWQRFIELVERLDGPSLALVPSPPQGPLPVQLEVRLNASDGEVQQQLRRCRLLFLPSDYESFGFAQAEALQQGCCVPVLGEWPLWLETPELDWRQTSRDEQTMRIEALANDEPRRRALVLRQQHQWKQRSERREAELPRVLEVGRALHS